MEKVLAFLPFQAKRTESCYRRVPVNALERLYLKEFGAPDNESILSCGSAVYGISDDKEIRALRKFSDIDYVRISRGKSRKPHYKTRKILRTDNSVTEIDVLTLGYDSCMKGFEDGSSEIPLTFAKFMVPLFDSEHLFLELTSKAMLKILGKSLTKEEVLITPSYAMMKINDARMYYQPYRWWTVHGEFILSPNANRNIEVYYDRVASTMEKLCAEGSLIKLDYNYVEPVYDASNLVLGNGQGLNVLDIAELYSRGVLAFLRGGNIPSLRKIVNVAYDGFDVGIGLLKGKTSCANLFNAKPQIVRVETH